MNVLSVVGARPQFIKAATVSRALRQRGIDEIVVHTGQHYDPTLSAIFFEELGLSRPNVNLAVGSGTHATQTAGMLVGLERVMTEHRADWILVYGDTNSTLAGALAAAKLRRPYAHVEGGLRMADRGIPEEINRRVADAFADLIFAPTAEAVRNLEREHVEDGRIRFVGDVMFDACLMFGERAARSSDVLERLDLCGKAYVLATVHRAENTDESDRLRAIVDGLVELASQRRVVLPLHPRTRNALQRAGLLGRLLESLTVLEPVGYLDMLVLERSAALIMTDSGGMQKEAFFFQVPCVTLFEETPWVELVALGWNVVCQPTDGASIAAVGESRIGATGRPGTPYGCGDAAQRIVEVLCDA